MADNSPLSTVKSASPLLHSSPWFGVGLKYKWNIISLSMMHEGRLEAGLTKRGK